jgi:capsule polysaccharide export protein KpsE/RkpR
MGEQKSAQLYVQAQNHRIKELTAELSQLRTAAGLMNSTADKSNADLNIARLELAEYRNQLDAVTCARRQRPNVKTSRGKLKSFDKNRRILSEV